jgi:RNA polymerase sigma factor (sigma-70 family)
MDTSDGEYSGLERIDVAQALEVELPFAPNGGEVRSFDETAGMSDAERKRIIDGLVASHYDRLCAFVVRRVGNHDDAMDIAQGAYLEAFRCLPRFAGRSNLSTWLYGIALNLLRSHLARNRSRETVSIDDAQDLLPIAEAPSVHDSYDARIDLDRVLEALEGAPADQRDTLLLVAIEGMSYHEAALKLGVAVGTVRSRVSRLRTALRTSIA